MNVIEFIKQRILKFLGLEKLSDNPSSSRYTFINDDEKIVQNNRIAYKTWYIGSSAELDNLYLYREVQGFYDNPIYNRNNKQLFWSKSQAEYGFHKIHSTIPKAIITTLVNAIGSPTISCEDKETNEVLQKIIESNDLISLINQQQMPLTMVEGDGGFKINIDATLSDDPIIEYYEGNDCQTIRRANKVVGMIFTDYYNYKGRDYALMETRRIKDGNSLIEYELFRISKGSGELTPVELSAVPELANLEAKEIKNLNTVFAVPSIFFFNPLHKECGLSLFEGKIDLFDALDQAYSIQSTTVQLSTPVEYFPKDSLSRTSDGKTLGANIYNRQYIYRNINPDGDGKTDNTIITTQPVLNIEQYDTACLSIINAILTGTLSPASMGIDIAKKDNADAQREKEKVTIMTRDNIIDRDTLIIKKLLNLCLMAKEYMSTGLITIKDYDISVKFSEFANPSFESLSATLTPMWTSGAISTKMYVEKLYGDGISDEEKASEILWLDNKAKEDNLNLGDFNNESGTGETGNIKEEETR